MNYVMQAGQKLEQKKGAHVCNIMYVVACVMSVLEADASSLLFSRRRDLMVKGGNKQGSRIPSLLESWQHSPKEGGLLAVRALS